MTTTTAALRLLHEAYQSVLAIEPVTEPELAEGIQKIFKYSGLIHAHIAGIQEASSLDDDEHLWEVSSSEEEEEEEEPTPIHRARFNAIVGIIGQPPLSPQELAQFLVNPPIHSHHESEQHGFFRLVRGYTPAKRTQDWLDLVGFKDPELEWAKFVADNARVQDNPDKTERLHARESALRFVNTADPVSLFRQTVHNSVQSLCFAIEWKEMSTVQGGRAWKKKYRTEAFRRQNPQFFASMYTRREYNSRLKTFRGRHEKIVTSRNCLLKLFQVFGCSALMDPTWTPIMSFDTGGTNRSRSFPALLTLVLAHIPQTEAQRSNSERVFLQLCGAFMNEADNCICTNGRTFASQLKQMEFESIIRCRF